MSGQEQSPRKISNRPVSVNSIYNNANYSPKSYAQPRFNIRGNFQTRANYSNRHQYRPPQYHPYQRQQQEQDQHKNCPDSSSNYDVRNKSVKNIPFNVENFLHPSMTEDPWKHLMKALKSTQDITSPTSGEEATPQTVVVTGSE